MARRKYFNQDSYDPPKAKELPKDDIVERDSYIDPKKQIQQMIMAGERLTDFRKIEKMYDVMEGDAEEDITRNKGFDMIDAQNVSNNLNNKYRDIKAERERRKKEKEDKVKEDEKVKAKAGGE